MVSLKKAAVSLCILACGFAAKPARAAWGIGPLGGANFANADISGRDTHSLTGWVVGARLEMGTIPFLSVMLDPTLVQSGAKFDAGTGSGRGEFLFLEVPLLLTARLGLGGLGVYGFLGPDLVLATDAEGDASVTERFRRSDLSPLGLAGQVGAGISLGVAPVMDITADARYTHGFTDLLEGARGDVRNWRNRDVQLTLGLLLHAPRI